MDNKAVSFKSHLNAVCTLTYVDEGEPRTSLTGSCGTEIFSKKTTAPSTYVGSDWVCEDPFSLINATFVQLVTGTKDKVFICTYKRPFLFGIDVTALKFG